MTEWRGASDISLIIIEECLYYLSHRQQEALLANCLQSITNDGTILVVIHDRHKHRATLDVCRRKCRIKDEITTGRRVFLLLGDPSERSGGQSVTNLDGKNRI
jgi:hypothetical protein